MRPSLRPTPHWGSLSAPHWVPWIGTALTACSALLAFGVFGTATASAAPSLPTAMIQTAHDAASSLGCAEVWSFGSFLELGPHADGGSLRCNGLQGVGVAVLALIAVVVIALGRMRLSTESKRLDVARQLVEQGIEPPAELLMGPARNDLRRGVVLMFAGAGLIGAGLLLGDRGMAAGALVPEFIGLGYLVSFYLAARARAPGGPS